MKQPCVKLRITMWAELDKDRRKKFVAFNAMGHEERIIFLNNFVEA